MRIGIGIGEIGNQPGTVDELITQARQAEREGFASAWLANIFGMDAMTAAAIAGRATSRIELGTAVVPTYYRHPFATAQQALSTQAACGNRFVLGIGLSHRIVIETMMGLSWARSYTHMKEHLAVVAALVREGRADFEGSEYRVHANLSVAGASSCPILLAALGPKMLALAGAVGDGTITWMTGPKTLREHTVPRIREAAERAGRPSPRVVVGLPVAVTNDVRLARETAGRVFQIYGTLPSYRAMLDREGAGGPADVAVVGDEEAVAEAIANLGESGVTDFLAAPFPVGENGRESIERTRSLFVSLARR